MVISIFFPSQFLQQINQYLNLFRDNNNKICVYFIFLNSAFETIRGYCCRRCCCSTDCKSSCRNRNYWSTEMIRDPTLIFGISVTNFVPNTRKAITVLFHFLLPYKGYTSHYFTHFFFLFFLNFSSPIQLLHSSFQT